MVVYHVENHPQAGAMSLVHETAEIVRLAIQPNRSELPNSVVAPSEAAGKISHRHHFEHGDSAVSQLREFPLSGLPCPFSREGPDVHFVNDLALEADALPPAVVPPETRRIHHLRRSVGPVRLIPRHRVRKATGVIQPEAIASALSGLRDQARKVSVRLLFQLYGRRSSRTSLQQHFHFLRARRPDAKMRAPVRLQLGTDGISSLQVHDRSPLNIAASAF